MEANRDTYVLKRGAYDAPGEKVTAGTPEALPANTAPRNRLDLAALAHRPRESTDGESHREPLLGNPTSEWDSEDCRRLRFTG